MWSKEGYPKRRQFLLQTSWPRRPTKQRSHLYCCSPPAGMGSWAQERWLNWTAGDDIWVLDRCPFVRGSSLHCRGAEPSYGALVLQTAADLAQSCLAGPRLPKGSSSQQLPSHGWGSVAAHPNKSGGCVTLACPHGEDWMWIIPSSALHRCSAQSSSSRLVTFGL